MPVPRRRVAPLVLDGILILALAAAIMVVAGSDGLVIALIAVSRAAFTLLEDPASALLVPLAVVLISYALLARITGSPGRWLLGHGRTGRSGRRFPNSRAVTAMAVGYVAVGAIHLVLGLMPDEAPVIFGLSFHGGYAVVANFTLGTSYVAVAALLVRRFAVGWTSAALLLAIGVYSDMATWVLWDIFLPVPAEADGAEAAASTVRISHEEIEWEQGLSGGVYAAFIVLEAALLLVVRTCHHRKERRLAETAAPS